ncbi:MAG: T9SS type A sorting domain-containing protein [Flavobacteriales bacterium]|nr:T9SS type A sorting domain-containing protein [Flavobacteriales bacterium]
MKRILLLSTILNFFALWLFAAHVDEQTARTVGGSFLSTLVTGSDRSANDLQLVYSADATGASAADITYFYVFQDEEGFVIVSGDDRSLPILAYSDQGMFDANEIPTNTRKWLEGYKTQLRQMIADDVAQPQESAEQWEMYLHGSVASGSRAAAVSPLVDTRWNQSPYYNALCPGGSVTGCVATAMAQVMKYWDYPANGSGFHSYNHSTYGTLSASFGNTTYQWSSMPNTVNSSNNAVATLMYHCGVSVDMDYSPQVSNAYVISAQSPVQHCSEYALKTYFGYDPSLHGEERDNYNDTQWSNLLKAELDASRPIIYAGFGSGGGHCFVCDGYDNSGFFHFNWGWAGAYDGYFSINALNPSGTGTGGGSGGYNSGHQVLIGIKPPGGGGGGGGGNDTYDLALYNYVTPSASTIYYGQSFSVSSNIVNQGQNDFSGDYGAAVFDSQGNFIDFVQTLTGYSLQAGYVYNNNLVFSTNGLFSMLPGTYYVGIFYKASGGNWIAAADNGSYTNVAQIDVINPNSIELNSSMNVSPGTTVTQGQNVSVNLNILNNGNSNFLGTYSVDLYNLDGSYVQSIATITESNGLPPGYTYLSPYLTFSNTISAAPGTYLLAVQHQSSGSSTWELTGSTNYQNPIYLTVQAPSLTPDQYEVNNTFNQSYTLSTSFSGNNANSNTVGSNLHTGEDNDFYGINLSSGYDYTVSARLHDSYNSGNGNTYSVDALFSYSTDGSNWSDTYDDVMPGNISVNNGGMVYFHVAPYFAGETGTYLLDINISRTAHVGIEEPEALKDIRVYPNPAVDLVTIDLSNSEGNLEAIELMSVDGKTVQSMNTNISEKLIRMPLDAVADGMYMLRLTTDKGIAIRRIVVGK